VNRLISGGKHIIFINFNIHVDAQTEHIFGVDNISTLSCESFADDVTHEAWIALSIRFVKHHLVTLSAEEFVSGDDYSEIASVACRTFVITTTKLIRLELLAGDESHDVITCGHTYFTPEVFALIHFKFELMNK